MAKVRNINGRSYVNCKCGSWLNHWERFSGQKTSFCIVTDCLETELVGAHVQRDTLYDKNSYVIPLCKMHNKSKSVLEISDIYVLVPANKKKTCEKELNSN